MNTLFSPERLKLARERRGLLKQELAARTDVTPRAVSSWESGASEPSSENVEAIARVLDFPRGYFFGDAPVQLANAEFRSLARMTAKQRSTALAAGAQAVALDEWISTRFDRPVAKLPDLRDSESPEGAADNLRALWALGYSPIPNLVHLLEAKGVRVYSLVHEGTSVDAFSDWHGGTPFIFLNTQKTAERSRLDAAHELGHLTLHAHREGGTRKEHEDAAQAFAGAFLMPRASFIPTAPRRPTLDRILAAKVQWGVSALAYVYRMRKLGLLSDWEYRSLCIQIRSTHGSSEPGVNIPRETSQVLSKVFAVSGGVRRTEAARDLNLRLADIDEITFGLTLTSVPHSIATSDRFAGQVSSNGPALPPLKLV